jgi:hypothetical protein
MDVLTDKMVREALILGGAPQLTRADPEALANVELLAVKARVPPYLQQNRAYRTIRHHKGRKRG